MAPETENPLPAHTTTIKLIMQECVGQFNCSFPNCSQFEHIIMPIILGFELALSNTLYIYFINFEPARQIFNCSMH